MKTAVLCRPKDYVLRVAESNLNTMQQCQNTTLKSYSTALTRSADYRDYPISVTLLCILSKLRLTIFPCLCVSVMSRRSSRLVSGGYYNSDEESDSSSVTNISISYRENPVK